MLLRKISCFKIDVRARVGELNKAQVISLVVYAWEGHVTYSETKRQLRVFRSSTKVDRDKGRETFRTEVKATSKHDHELDLLQGRFHHKSPLTAFGRLPAFAPLSTYTLFA